MMRRPGVSALSYYLGCTMYVGAANADATPEQRAQLRDALQPFIESKNVEGFIEVVNLIMGPQWKPRDKWRGFWSNSWDR